MAREIMRLFKKTDVRSRKILVMAGHEGGIVTFGKNLEEACDVVMGATKGIISLHEDRFL
jgi:L-ribulose-5-phosphate 4-epimerase